MFYNRKLSFLGRKKSDFWFGKTPSEFPFIFYNFLIFLSFFFPCSSISVFYIIYYLSNIWEYFLGNNYCFNNWFLSSCRSDNFRTTEKFIGFFFFQFSICFFLLATNWSKRITPIKSNGYRHPSKHHKIVGYYKNLIDFPTKYPWIEAKVLIQD